METSAAFKAASVVGIQAAALLQVSDVIPAGKSLFLGRTKAEMKHKLHIKENLLPELVLGSLTTWR